jgi:two-component system cell cycle response regulator
VLRAEAPQVPLVVLTGADDEQTAVDALCAGAQDCLAKGQVESKLLAHALWSAVERHRLTQHVRTMSLIDELTGLHNRHGFEVIAMHQLRLADRYARSVLLIFVDINGLKRINDLMGHHEGDRAIVETATALKDSFRGCDIAARWGGDEFVVLTSECPSDSADVLIDRLATNLWLREISAGLPYELRVTAGSAAYDPANPCSLGNLIRQADEDMRRRRGEPVVPAGRPVVNPDLRRQGWG